jgi:hypothetical protein
MKTHKRENGIPQREPNKKGNLMIERGKNLKYNR